MSRFLEKLGWVLLRDRFLILDKGREGVLRGGSFQAVDFSHHVLVDKTRHLVIEKGKYKITHRNGRTTCDPNDSVGMAVIDNSRLSYDEFWRNDDVVTAYHDKARGAFYKEVLAICQKYIHGRVIDIGCGSGGFLQLLAQREGHERLYGIDFSASSLTRCHRVMAEGGFVQSDIYHLGCHDESFETVICMETIEHLEHPDEAMREVRRVCSRDGLVIITIPNGPCDGYVGHLNFWSEDEFRSMLGREKIIDFRYVSAGHAMVFVTTR
jgi:2-polyprenyl-3-methyl-5-hydroxy-6-metoxy-1,4-benzoquinol methylase